MVAQHAPHRIVCAGLGVDAVFVFEVAMFFSSFCCSLGTGFLTSGGKTGPTTRRNARRGRKPDKGGTHDTTDRWRAARFRCASARRAGGSGSAGDSGNL